jgi:hypothetical protein
LTRVAAEGSKAILSICIVLRWVPKGAPYCEDEWTSLNESQNSKTILGTAAQVSLGRHLLRSAYRPGKYCSRAFQMASKKHLRTDSFPLSISFLD